MAEFGEEITQAPDIAAAETPKTGVVTETAQTPVDRRGLSTAFEAAAGLFANRKANKREKALADFTRRQILVADAYDQGRIRSASEARSLMRNNLLDILETNPDDLDFALEAIQAQNKILGISGGAKIIDERTDEENRKNAQFNAYVEAGLMPHNASEAEFNETNQVFLRQKEAEAKYKTEMDTINRAKSVAELEKSQLDLLNKRAAQATREMFRGSIQGEIRGMDAQFKAIVNSEQSVADKVQSIEQMFIEFTTLVAPHAANLPTDERDLYLKPFEQTRDLYLKLATGELTLDAFEKANKSIKATTENLMLQNETIAKWAVASELFNFGAFSLPIQQEVFSEVTEIIGNNTKPQVNPDKTAGITSGNNPFNGDSTTAKAYDEVMKMAAKGVESGDENITEDSLFQFDAILGNMAGSEAAIRGAAKDAIDFMRVLSNPRYGEFVREHGEDLQNLDEAARIAQEHYADEVWGMVQSEFNQVGIVDLQAAEATGGEGNVQDVTRNLSDLVTYRTTQAGMEFIPIDPNNGGAVAKARELNKTLKPAINTTVQALSNLQGDLNYGAAWERVARDILQTGDPDALDPRNQTPAGGDVGDELNLEDFSFPTVSSGGVPQEVANDTEFMSEVERLSKKYKWDPSILLGIIDFETGGTFSPSKANAAGSGATGLIQFIQTTARSLGTSTSELAKMTRAEQMQFVEKYLDQFGSKIVGADPADVYMAVLFPKAINKSDDFVLFKFGSKAYRQNSGLDRNGDGTITKAEAARNVVRLVGKHEAKK